MQAIGSFLSSIVNCHCEKRKNWDRVTSPESVYLHLEFSFQKPGLILVTKIMVNGHSFIIFLQFLLRGNFLSSFLLPREENTFTSKNWKWQQFTVDLWFKGPAYFCILKLWCRLIPTQNFYPKIWQTQILGDWITMFFRISRLQISKFFMPYC